MQERSAAVNSREWWNEYFAGQWDAHGGSVQTLHFTQRLLDSLPKTECDWLRAKPRSILDWGCAFGEGVMVIADAFPSASVSGLDFSPVAIAEARTRYPGKRFIQNDDGAIAEEFDCIITSNCLEHFDDPAGVIEQHLRSCRYLYIALVPFDESSLHEGHRVRLREEHFPPELGRFALLYTARVDVDRQLWNGQQLLIVYASPEYRVDLAELGHAGDSRDASSAREARLNEELTALRRRSATLDSKLAIRSAELAAAETALASARGRVSELGQRLAVASARIQQLINDAGEHEKQRAALARAVAELEASNTRIGRDLEASRLQLRDAETTIRARDAELVRLRAHADDLATQRAYSIAEVAVLKQSLTWRMTAPFRRLSVAFPAIERVARVGAKFVWYTLTLQLPAAIRRTARRRRDRNFIASAGGFDAEWYRQQYPDVALSGVHPLVHFVAHGVAEGRNPNRIFDTQWYLAQNADLDPDRLNPLAHYLKYGAAEGRDPGPLLDTDWYLATYPDVQAAGQNPLVHYLNYGAAEGRRARLAPAQVKPAKARAKWTKYDVVILANIDWHARWQRPQQLAQQFVHHGHRVFYVVAHPNIPDEPGRSFEAVEVADGVVRITLPQRCFFDRYAGAVRGGSLAQCLASLDELTKRFDIADAVVHVHLASWTPLALALRDTWLWKVIYDCMDEWDGFPGIGADLLAAERDLVQRADAVTVTGPLLFEKWSTLARRCEVVRNGVEYSFFEQNCIANDAFDFPSPVIGYYGAIAEWLDLDLIAEVARRNPDWRFVLAGDVFVPDLRGLDRLANVTLLGLRPYREMPLLLWHFDVCVIPFKVNAMTHAVDPVKLYEYLSGGKPVVSVPLKEVLVHQGVIACASGPDEFENAIASALKKNDSETVETRRALAARNQWTSGYEQTNALVLKAYPSISIIIVTFDNCDLTRACIESVVANTTQPNYEIIIVDNASSDDTAEYLRGVEARSANIKVILNAQNRGFAAANNQGLAIAKGDILVLLNNDVVVTRGWMRGLLRTLNDPAVGLAGPVTNSVGNEARIPVSNEQLSDLDAFASAHMFAHMNATFDISVLAMYCLAMRRDAFDKIGPLDEGFSVGMFEDDDYANRARQAGYRVVCTEESFVQHAGQAAFKKLIQSGEYQAIWDRNRAYYEAKWGKWSAHKHRQ